MGGQNDDIIMDTILLLLSIETETCIEMVHARAVDAVVSL